MFEFSLDGFPLDKIRVEYKTLVSVVEKYKFLLLIEKELNSLYEEIEHFSSYNQHEFENYNEIKVWLGKEYEYIRKISQIDNPRLFKIMSREEITDAISVIPKENSIINTLENQDTEEENNPPRIKWLLTIKQLRLLLKLIFQHFGIKIPQKNIDILIYLHFVDKKGNEFTNRSGYSFNKTLIQKIIWPGNEEQIIYLNMKLSNGFIMSNDNNYYSFVTDHFITNDLEKFKAAQLSKVFYRMKHDGQLIKKDWHEAIDNILNRVKS